MAQPSIRGHQHRLQLFVNGEDTGVQFITNWEVNQDSSFSRSNYVGAARPEGDQSMEGWSGSFDMEVKGSEVDDIMDEIIRSNQSGIGVPDVVMVHTEFYPNGQIKAHAYYDMQLRMSKRVAGLTEKTTKRIDFQASDREAL